MKVIGLTGGIGAGKTTVLRLMEQHFGVRSIVSDDIGHLAYEPGSETYQQILLCFSKEILCADSSEVDLKKLSKLVMTNIELLDRLNGIIHPFVRSYVENALEQARKEQVSYFVIESAILLECGYEDICDEFWYVHADEQVRRERLKKDRGYSEEKVDQIYKNQAGEAYFREKCTKTIENNGKKESILEQLKFLLV